MSLQQPFSIDSLEGGGEGGGAFADKGLLEGGGHTLDTDARLIEKTEQMMKPVNDEATVSDLNGETLTTTTTGAIISPNPVRQRGDTNLSQIDADDKAPSQQQPPEQKQKKRISQSNSTFYVPINDSDVEDAEEVMVEEE